MNIKFEVNMFNEFILDNNMDGLYIWDSLEDLIESSSATKLLDSIKQGLDINAKYFIDDIRGCFKSLSEEEVFDYIARLTDNDLFEDWFGSALLDKNGYVIR